MDCYLYIQISESSLIGIVLAGTVTILMFVVSIILFVTLYHKKQQVFEETRKRQAAEYDAKLHADRVTETERLFRDISNTLHDHVGSKLAFLATVLSDLCNRHQRDQTVSADHLQLSRQLANEITESLRQLNSVVGGTVLLERGLLHAVQKEIAFAESCSGLDISLKTDPNYRDSFDPKTALHIFRIIQESITNAIKHARGDTVHVRLAIPDLAQLQVSITDNGSGFDITRLDESATLGLNNLRFRAECIGAELSIDSHPGSGTTVRLIVPVVL